MNSKPLCLLITFGIIISLLSSCEKEDPIKVDNYVLLTNDSSKIWLLSKIILDGSLSPLIPDCILDDELSFNINGSCLKDNMGTIYKSNPSPFDLCSDTTQIVDTVYWELNNNQDTLTIFWKKHISFSKIIDLTTDSLILNTKYPNTDPQKEVYYAKEVHK